MSRAACISDQVKPDDVSNAAILLYEAFVKNERYGPVDKLALASSGAALLVALYEVERGVRSGVRDVEKRSEWGSLARLIDIIASDARSSECLEKALRLAHELAVKALAQAARR